MIKTMKSICLLLVIVSGAAAGVSSEQSRADINPALLYYQAFLVTPDLEQGDRDLIEANELPGQKLPERFGEIVAKSDNQFSLLRRAAHATAPCDWGIDRSAGPSTLMPPSPAPRR
jgi:hypothetical protein